MPSCMTYDADNNLFDEGWFANHSFGYNFVHYFWQPFVVLVVAALAYLLILRGDKRRRGGGLDAALPFWGLLLAAASNIPLASGPYFSWNVGTTLLNWEEAQWTTCAYACTFGRFLAIVPALCIEHWPERWRVVTAVAIGGTCLAVGSFLTTLNILLQPAVFAYSQSYLAVFGTFLGGHAQAWIVCAGLHWASANAKPAMRGRLLGQLVAWVPLGVLSYTFWTVVAFDGKIPPSAPYFEALRRLPYGVCQLLIAMALYRGAAATTTAPPRYPLPGAAISERGFWKVCVPLSVLMTVRFKCIVGQDILTWASHIPLWNSTTMYFCNYIYFVGVLAVFYVGGRRLGRMAGGSAAAGSGEDKEGEEGSLKDALLAGPAGQPGVGSTFGDEEAVGGEGCGGEGCQLCGEEEEDGEGEDAEDRALNDESDRVLGGGSAGKAGKPGEARALGGEPRYPFLLVVSFCAFASVQLLRDRMSHIFDAYAPEHCETNDTLCLFKDNVPRAGAMFYGAWALGALLSGRAADCWRGRVGGREARQAQLLAAACVLEAVADAIFFFMPMGSGFEVWLFLPVILVGFANGVAATLLLLLALAWFSPRRLTAADAEPGKELRVLRAHAGLACAAWAGGLFLDGVVAQVAYDDTRGSGTCFDQKVCFAATFVTAGALALAGAAAAFKIAALS